MPLFRQAVGACVGTDMKNIGLSRSPAVVRRVLETGFSRVVARGQMKYTGYQVMSI